jgi:hypothetical protein
MRTDLIYNQLALTHRVHSAAIRCQPVRYPSRQPALSGKDFSLHLQNWNVMNLSQTNTAVLHLIDSTPTKTAPPEKSEEMSMQIEELDLHLHEPNKASTRPELLVSAVLHLMSHYTARSQEESCIKLASVIERHLKALASLQNVAPVLRATCLQLSTQWADIVDQAMIKPKKRGLMRRLLLTAP